MSQEMRRVLEALCSQASDPDQILPLRRIAESTLGSDAEKAARVLADLDFAGYVRTDIMGWLRGWLTEKGRQEGGRG